MINYCANRHFAAMAKRAQLAPCEIGLSKPDITKNSIPPLEHGLRPNLHRGGITFFYMSERLFEHFVIIVFACTMSLPIIES